MQHLIMFPVLLPMLTALLILLPPIHKSAQLRREISMIATFILFTVSVLLLVQIRTQGIIHYAVGDWQAPFGIILVADTLAAVLVCLTAFLAIGAVCYSSAGEDEKGSFFHPLFQFQLMGINGAFLTGDLFNLFVFFEVLLIASYALLIHAGGKNKTRAAVHYVVLNLTGSAVFLFSLAILYGALGTLNIADMALRVAALPEEQTMLVKVGALLLLVVFALKAAVLPLQFWLPATYSSASPAVAALFAVMTKIGVYALLRVYTTVFGEQAGPLAGIASDWLWWSGLLTIMLGAVGVLASNDLRRLVANLVIVSVGTLVSLVAVQQSAASATVVYYTVHSTVVTGALFLLADLIATQRGKAGERLVSARPIAQPVLLGMLFLVAALTVAGLPPLSGFIGKIMILQSVTEPLQRMVFWPVVLLSSLMVLIGISRAGSTLFWRVSGTESGNERAHPLQLFGVCWLLFAAPVMVVFAGVLTSLGMEAAVQLHDVPVMIETILGNGSILQETSHEN